MYCCLNLYCVLQCKWLSCPFAFILNIYKYKLGSRFNGRRRSPLHVRCRRKKFTFDISSPGEFLFNLVTFLTFLTFFNFSYVFGERERSRSLYAIARPSVVCLSVTLVHPTQSAEIFSNFYAIWYLGHPNCHPQKILRRSSQGTPPPGGVKHKSG